MRFHIKATIANGQDEWEEDLGIHEESSRRGLSLAVHQLHTENMWAVRMHARELSTGEILSYRQDAGGFFEPVGSVFGGQFRKFEGDSTVNEATADTRYNVATYSYACTAYVRTALRRALELQPTHNVWAGPEYVNTARDLVPNTYVTCKLPDETTWELTKLELMTIHRALEWRRGHREAGRADRKVRRSTADEWAHIEDEIYRVLQGIWHSEGKYWM